jgi:chaperonin cofactor prefoldin
MEGSTTVSKVSDDLSNEKIETLEIKIKGLEKDYQEIAK